MEFETYADVIDAYNADNMGYSTLTDYIKDQNIKIKEIEMDPIGDMRKIFESKADGGSIGIEVLFKEKMANGGRVPAFSGGFAKFLFEGAKKGKQGIMELIETGKGKFDDFVETQANKKMFRSVDDIPPTNISQAKGPMTIEMMEAVDPSIVNKLLNTQRLGLYDETPEILKAANLLERFTKKVKGKRVIDYERAEAILGVPLKGDETINDLFRIEFETRPVETLAEGGRVGLFMGGDPLEGQALQIYNSMKGYNFSDQEIADALSARGLYTPAGSETTTTAPEGIIGAQLNQDRDDGPKGDFGLFGNLLKDTEKTFTKDVYTEIGPGKFDFVPTEVTGYKNVKTGNYQTEAGKNINHLGLEIPTIAGMLFDKNFGKGPQLGDIKGTFTDGIPSNFFNNPFGMFKKQQATVADINAMNLKAIKDMEAKQREEEAAARRELENKIISGGPVITGGGDGGNFTTSAGTFAPGDYSDVAGTLADPREKMDYYRDGGLATMFTRRR